MAADLRKCYSEDDLPTAPWRFPLSFIPFLVPYMFLSKVQISPKVTIACNGFSLLRHTKLGLILIFLIYNLPSSSRQMPFFPTGAKRMAQYNTYIHTYIHTIHTYIHTIINSYMYLYTITNSNYYNNIKYNYNVIHTKKD